MEAKAVTIMSGIVLLAVFALAGWLSRRRRDRREYEREGHGASHRD